MKERQKARLLKSDPSGEDSGRLLSKQGFNILVAIIVGNVIGGTLDMSGAVPEITTRILIIVALLLALDGMLNDSRQWIPPMVKQKLRES